MLSTFSAIATSVAAQPLDSPPPPPPLTTRRADAPDLPSSAPPSSAPSSPTPRPWLYAADPTAPLPGRVVASLGVGYAHVDRGAARPFAADVAHAGAVFNASAEVGVAPWLSAHAEGLVAGQGQKASVSAGALIGVSAFPFARRLPVDVSVSAGYLRELGGDNGIWGRVAVAGNVGAARLTLSALGEHVVAKNRDGVDLMLMTGASVALLPYLRLGTEYVVQDLEGAWDPEEADGGIRHFVGPTAVVILYPGVQLSGGPSFGLSAGSPAVLGRVAATYAF